jgi:hypothetical protein
MQTQTEPQDQDLHIQCVSDHDQDDSWAEVGDRQRGDILSNVTDDLNRFELINACDTAEQLVIAIGKIADPLGRVQGRDSFFNAVRLQETVRYIATHPDRLKPGVVSTLDGVIAFPTIYNSLTRAYGIRQQMLYIVHYGEKAHLRQGTV